MSVLDNNSISKFKIFISKKNIKIEFDEKTSAILSV